MLNLPSLPSAAALEQASQAFMAGNFQEALDVWTTTLSVVENEHHYALHTNRGAALERLGRIQDAIEAYDQALQSKPDHVEALHNRGVGEHHALAALTSCYCSLRFPPP